MCFQTRAFCCLPVTVFFVLHGALPLYCSFVQFNAFYLFLLNVIPLYPHNQSILQLSHQYSTVNALTFIYKSQTRHVSAAIIRRYCNRVEGKLKKRPLIYIIIQPEIIILLQHRKNNQIYKAIHYRSGQALRVPGG
jgi:hypothetical protein